MTVDWREFAACIGQPELFYTDEHLHEAQQICASCPVILHCRAGRRRYELKHKQAHPGVWAGEYWTIRNGNVKQPMRAKLRT